MRVLFVVKDSPAHKLLERVCERVIRPGEVIPVTAEELTSLDTDCHIMDIGEVQREL